ncbi:amino acid adenylation domain-containing protein [Spongiimicrobium salis]|uniref:amino acid adenylation domain-containing protein n=1 Tax=Spongiimicrobium salis TaxID=1667022 RepID=UPI00374CFA60
MSRESNLNLQELNANQNIITRNYWKNRLGQLEYHSYITPDLSAHSATEDPYVTYTCEIPKKILETLDDIARSVKAKQMIVLGSFGIFLQKYSSQDEIHVFYQLQHSENKGVLPFKFPAISKNTFPQYMESVSRLFMEDMEYSDFPLTKILGQSLKNIQELPQLGISFNGHEGLSDMKTLNPEVILSFDLDHMDKIHFLYRSNGYTEAKIVKTIASFFTILEKLFQYRETEIRHLELISEVEKKRIMGTFNNTKRTFPHTKTLIHLFQEQVERTPDKIAIQYKGEVMSYTELDEKSNQIANYLVSNKIMPSSVIGVQMDRSASLIPVIYGILKAGCVYLPLSKNHPRERLEYTLKDSKAHLIITDVVREDSFIKGFKYCHFEEINEDDNSNICLATPTALAYIIYTSGSTGKPKGTLIRHRSVVNRIYWMQKEYQLTPQDSILQKTPLVFDVSIWELFWWSIVGAKLILAAPNDEKNPKALCDIIDNEGVSVLHFVPSMLNVLIDYLVQSAQKNRLRSVRHLFASGEELKVEDARKFMEYCPKGRLHNLYGPTEATVDVSYHEVLRTEKYKKIPIGKPIYNTQLYIVNPKLQLQPIGLPGELLIGGENLALGYLNQQKLTTEKFIANPWDPKSKLYRTGDIAAWLPNGEIEFLGRKDDQVKIRGNRVELREIEHAINGFQGIKNAIVLPKEVNGQLQLVGFLIKENDFFEDELKSFLTAKIPDYMLPSYFIEIEKPPFTVNGKLDKKKLLSLEPTNTSKYVEPKTPAEIEMAHHWMKILDKKKIGVEDNFFAIGGDSILAVRLLGRIHNEMQLDFSVIDLYENNTITQLIAFIERTERVEKDSKFTEVERELALFQENYLKQYPDDTIEAVYPMCDIEKGMCFLHNSRPEDTLYFEQIMIPITYKEMHVNVLQSALDLLVKKHEVFRIGFNLNEFAHVVYREIPTKITFNDLTGIPTAEQKVIIQENLEKNRKAHFDLSAKPIWRIILYRLKEGHHEIVFEYHHALLDGWSIASFITELNNTYINLLKDPAFKPKLLKSSYKDYIKEELFHKKDEATRAFWKKELQGFKKLKLNTKRIKEKRFESVREVYPAQLLKNLKTIEKERHVTVKTLILSAYINTMRILSGQRDILIGVVTFSRPLKQDGDKMLGCFLNTIPFRIQLPEVLTWNELIALVDKKFLEIKKYDHLSLFEINQAIGAVTHEGNPLFDTAFNVINWHIMKEMETEETIKEELDRLDFDVFLRGNTFFDANFNINEERILCMHEYSSPFMTKESYEVFNAIFLSSLGEIIANSESSIKTDQTFWEGEKTEVFNQLRTDNKVAKAYRQAPVALSARQQEIWKMTSAEKTKGEHISMTFDITGEFKLDIFKESLQETYAMHSVLRTVLVKEGKVMSQRILGMKDFVLDFEQVQKFDEKALAQISNEVFDMDKNLTRIRIVEQSKNKHKLYVIAHRLLLDYPSMVQIIQTVLFKYQQLLDENVGMDIKKETVSFQDYANWESESLNRLAPILLNYWKRNLEGLKALEMPTDHTKDRALAYKEGIVTSRLSPNLIHRIRNFSGRDNAKTELVLLAAFKVLLYKYVGHSEVVLGCNTNTRIIDEMQNSIGPWENIMTLRSTIDPEMTFNEYFVELERIRGKSLDHRMMPINALVEEYTIEEEIPQKELFNLLFQYENKTVETLKSSQLEIILSDFNLRYGDYDIQIVFCENSEDLDVKVWFNETYFESETIEALLRHYNILIQNLINDPNVSLSEIDMVSKSEEQELLRHLDFSKVNYPREKTVVSLFQEQVVKNPNKEAVKCGDEVLTYGELDKRSNQVARLLFEQGVRKESLVMLLLDRSIETIIGIMGILKAGGAYLPVDVEYPEERIQYMIKDSQSKFMLSSKDISCSNYAIAILHIEAALEESSAAFTPNEKISPSNLCYVLYTSGTTGNPKGAMIEHRNVVRLFFNDEFQFDLDERDVWTMFHSPCFDFSVWEMYGALLNGGKLIVIPKSLAMDTRAYIDVLIREKVTILNQTPSALQNLVQLENESENCELRLKYVFVGGEAVQPILFKDWKLRYPNVKLVILYGITETTVIVSGKELGNYEIENDISNIGKTLPTISGIVLDKNKKLVPNGVIGELYVGGSGIGRGYLGKKELTKERFIEHPYDSNEILYKTGDLVRVRNSGDMEYKGRIDHQVQLRGFRIELGEIENVLLNYDKVHQAVVFPEKRSSGMYLLCYYTAEKAIEIEELQAHLAQHLPDYMIPGHFCYLNSFPLTTSGKINKEKLPKIKFEENQELVPPESELEKKLALLWSNVLEMDIAHIGITQSFFEIGGHSLSAMNLIGKIQKIFGIKLSLQDFFSRPTIKFIVSQIELGSWLRNKEKKETSSKRTIKI